MSCKAKCISTPKFLGKGPERPPKSQGKKKNCTAFVLIFGHKLLGCSAKSDWLETSEIFLCWYQSQELHHKLTFTIFWQSKAELYRADCLHSHSILQTVAVNI